MHAATSEKDKIKIGSGNSWKPKQISSMLERLWTPGDRRSGLHSQTRQFHPGDRYHRAQHTALTVVHKGVKLHCTSAHAPCNEGKRKRELCNNKSRYENVIYSDPDVHGNPLTKKNVRQPANLKEKYAEEEEAVLLIEPPTPRPAGQSLRPQAHPWHHL